MHRSIWFVLGRDIEKRGSIPHALLALADRLRLEDVSVTMVLAKAPAPAEREALRGLAVDVRVLDFESARAPMALFLWFQEYRPAIVQLHFAGHPPCTFVAAAKLARACTVVQERDFTGPRGLLLDRVIDMRIEGSAVSLRRFENRDGSAVRRRLGLGAAPLVVCITPLDEMKGAETVVRAMALLDPEVHLAFAGGAGFAAVGSRRSRNAEASDGGRCEMALRSIAGKLGISKRVHFLGARDEVEDVLLASSVVVVSSPDTSSLAAIEGMAAARPVIVTRSGALPTVVADAGIVVPQEDPASLGLAIHTVLSDPEEGARLGRLGRKRVEETYSTDVYADRLLKTYRRILLRSEPRTEPSRILQVA
ncbi:MAG: glycosyltransferase family 4 protein [Myxococcales bacterium]